MKMSKRFDSAVNKLYTAFHGGTLQPECCKQCAVGNIMDNTDSWKHLTQQHGGLQLSYVGTVHERLGRRFNGYLPSELLQLEAEFLKGCGYKLPYHHKNQSQNIKISQDMLFEGLCSCVTYLSRLEGISDALDYSALFQYSPSTKLSEEKETALV